MKNNPIDGTVGATKIDQSSPLLDFYAGDEFNYASADHPPLAIWLGISLCGMSLRQSLALIRTIGIMALVIIGLVALPMVVGYHVNSTFAVYL